MLSSRTLYLPLTLAAFSTFPVYGAVEQKSDADVIRFQHENPLQPALVKIRKITIIGTQYEDAIRLTLRARAGDEITPESIKQEQQRIMELGYFSDVTPRLLKQAEDYELVIYVHENPQVNQVTLSGIPTLVERDFILKELSILEDRHLNFAHLNDVKATVEAEYRKAGYPFAHLSFKNFEDQWLDKKGILHAEIHEGVVESIVVEGNARTETDVITRELRLKSGDIFQQEAFREDLQRLHRLGYFEEIDVIPSPGKVNPHHFQVRLVVTEKKTADVGLNFTLNNRDGLLGGVHFTDTNFLGKGQYMNAKFQAGLDLLNLFNGNAQQSQRSFFGRVDFAEPFLLPDRTSLGSSLFSERTPLFFNDAMLPELAEAGSEGIFQTRTGVSLNVGKPLFGDMYSPWKGNLAFTAEQVSLRDFQNKALSELTFSKRHDASDTFFNLSGTLSFDNRDSVLSPSQGIYGALQAKPVWGDGNYVKVAGNVASFWSILDPGLTLAMGLQGGALLGEHPVYEQFFGTGLSTIRGWQENGSLAGSQYFIGSLEARFPVFDPVSGVLFSDMGNFFDTTVSRMDDILALKYGVGAGVRVKTPLGLLRLDYGVRDFSRLNWDSWLDAGQLHFSIGHKF